MVFALCLKEEAAFSSLSKSENQQKPSTYYVHGNLSLGLTGN